MAAAGAAITAARATMAGATIALLLMPVGSGGRRCIPLLARRTTILARQRDLDEPFDVAQIAHFLA
ncbi:MAG: hypothetical protein WA702_17340, partial [Bradyrhizobium sp.]